MAGKNWISCCLAEPFENATRHAGHTGDEVRAVRVFEEQLQPLVHQPCRPHADSRPHHLQQGRRRQECAWRPFSCWEHATDPFVLGRGGLSSSPVCLISSKNGRIEAEDDDGDDEANATASKEPQLAILNWNPWCIVQICPSSDLHVIGVTCITLIICSGKKMCNKDFCLISLAMSTLQLTLQGYIIPQTKLPCFDVFCTIYLYCCQRLALYLNSLFTYFEHFQTKWSLVKHWQKSQKKEKLQILKSKSDFIEALIWSQSLSSCQPAPRVHFWRYTGVVF